MSLKQRITIAEELKALGFVLERNIHRKFIIWRGVVGNVEIKKFVTIKAIRAFIADEKAKNKSENA